MAMTEKRFTLDSSKLPEEESPDHHPQENLLLSVIDPGYLTLVQPSDVAPKGKRNLYLWEEEIKLWKDRPTVVASSSVTLGTTRIPYFGNGFIGTIFEAFQHHHELVLRPDDVWLQIVTVLANYVEQHNDEVRSMFVDHEGQQELAITVDSVVTADWNSVTEEFVKKMKLKDEWSQWFAPSFTTTTREDRLLGRFLLMGTMKKYFKFDVRSLCGIPSIVLRGTIDDWRALRRKIDRLFEFKQEELTEWHSHLVPVLEKIITELEGTEPDLSFWDSICQYDKGSGGPFISGWCLVFVPFNNNKLALKMGYDKFALKKEWRYPRRPTDSIDSGVITVPITLDHRPATISVGSLFTDYDQPTNQVHPRWGWLITRRQ